MTRDNFNLGGLMGQSGRDSTHRDEVLLICGGQKGVKDTKPEIAASIINDYG
jgi:hypothetical protein